MTTPPSKASSQPSVFLSYARADDDPNYDDPAKSFLRRLYNHLTAAGFSIWWDRVSLPSRGETFTSEIELAICACQRFILVVGPGAVASEYVAKEWQFALSQCLPITPILRAGGYALVPEPLRTVNCLDFRPTRTEMDALADLVDRLQEDTLPLGQLINVPPLPPGFITREKAFKAAYDASRPGVGQGLPPVHGRHQPRLNGTSPAAGERPAARLRF